MGYELWYSKSNRSRRKNTRIVDIERNILNKFTVNLIYEDLLSTHQNVDPETAIRLMKERDYDYIGITGDANENIGFIHKQQILHGSAVPINDFSENMLVSPDQTIGELFILFKTEPVLFVKDQHVIGIITKADFNKPISRIYIFSIISMFELHLNYWITNNFQENKWEDILGEKRLEAAKEIFRTRQGNNEALTLLECLQLCDKKIILINCPSFLKEFALSKTKLKDLMETLEVIRNEIAHSQTSIISNKGLIKLCNMVTTLLEIIRKSDRIIEEK
ncbi:MAG: hypothetical protein LBF27_10365 [Sphingobacterium sp.]|jgi:hypothetical protein|nr:hypothetical protein [Sphingobacterium sp.]